jgi:signal transduction histidine kinase
MAFSDSVAMPAFRVGESTLITDYPRRGGAAPEMRAAIGCVAVAALTASGRIGGALAVGWQTGRHSLVEADLAALTDLVAKADVAGLLAASREERTSARLLEDRLRVAADLQDHVIQELYGAGLSLARVAALVTDGRARAGIERICILSTRWSTGYAPSSTTCPARKRPAVPHH